MGWNRPTGRTSRKQSQASRISAILKDDPQPIAVPFVGNPQKAAERLWAVSGVKGATLHDLRRTLATYSARAGTPRLVVGKILGHADADVTGRYDAHAYDREKRDALAMWAAELLRIASGRRQAKQLKVLPWASGARA